MLLTRFPRAPVRFSRFGKSSCMPRRVLFITSSRIGDAVLSSGLLAHLIQREPRSKFTVACGPLVSELFHDVPRLDNIIPLSKKKNGGHWFQLWRETYKKKWDRIVDLRSSGISYFLRARYRHVLKKSDAHRVVAASEVLGLEAPAAPHIYLLPDRQRLAVNELGPGPFVAVAPSANWSGKQWPIDRFVDLLKDLTGYGGLFRDHRILVLGAPNERKQIKPLLDAFAGDKIIDNVGRSGLLSVYGYLTACDFFIGNDSGLMHMAAAAGIPTLGLFGPTDETRYAPWGVHADFVRGPRSYAEILAEPGYDWRKPVSYMLDLEVGTVLAAVHDLKERTDLIVGEIPKRPTLSAV